MAKYGATVADESAELIGRQAERHELSLALQSGRPELIAVIGRRRIGKTYLTRSFFAPNLCFELTGVRDAARPAQLKTFTQTLQKATGFKHGMPEDWSDAFQELIRYLEALTQPTRKVVFFDELPWLAGRRSGFLPAFEHFWNSWGSRRKDLIVVVCGSAASWMITKVLHQKGGLHNRVTRSVALRPFSLAETESFLRARGIRLARKQILELSMALGGVPYYLDYVRKGKSAAQTIDTLFFAPNAPLLDEFDKLFAALFDGHERHVAVIRALARKQSGLSRDELIAATGMASGGTMTAILQELETSGFIAMTTPFGRTARDCLYRLIDELTLFHIRWIDGKRHRADGESFWAKTHSTPTWHAWSGYAFENLCLKHVAGIKKALGISGVQTDSSAWRHAAAVKGDTGAQIDLLIDRRDGVINVCEMKFCDTEYTIDKKYSAELRNKLEVFRRVTGTRKTLFMTMVTPYGVKSNEHRLDLVQNSVTMDALFD